MARTFFDLPRELIDIIMNMRVQLELDEDPYLKIAHQDDVCFSCGCENIRYRVNHNRIHYKFCSFCLGHNNTLPFPCADPMNHSRCFNMYKNYLKKRGHDMKHFENFFHDVVHDLTAPGDIQEKYGLYMLPDNGHAFDYGESEDEVNSA